MVWTVGAGVGLKIDVFAEPPPADPEPFAVVVVADPFAVVIPEPFALFEPLAPLEPVVTTPEPALPAASFAEPVFAEPLPFSTGVSVVRERVVDDTSTPIPAPKPI